MPLKAYSILVVEDSGFQAAEVEDILSYASAKVLGPVRSLIDARTILESQNIDAVVLDINLEKEVTYPFAEELQETGIPFIFLSGSVMPCHVNSAFKEVPFVEKPIRENVLLQALILVLLA